LKVFSAGRVLPRLHSPNSCGVGEGEEALEDAVKCRVIAAVSTLLACLISFPAFAQGNTAPVAVNDSYTQETGTTETLSVLANDTDADSDALSMVDGSNASNGGDWYVINGSTQAVYTAGNVGTETFTYVVSDGNGGYDTGTVTITVTASSGGGNSAPVAVDDTYTQETGTTATLSVLANDTDADSDALYMVDGSNASNGGDWDVTNGSTQVVYTAGNVGTETFTYVVSDGNGGTDTGTVTITVTASSGGGGNTAPVAVDDSYTVEAGSTTIFSLLANDTDADSDTLAITNGTDGSNGGYWELAGGGTQAEYDAGPAGTAVFTYQVSDGNGGTDWGTVTVTVTAASGGNAAPVAVDDSYTVEAGSTTIFSVLANDTDADNDTLAITNGTDGTNSGYWELAGGGTQVEYDAGPEGTAVFTYQVSDGNGGSDFDSGLQSVSVDLGNLSAGSHTIEFIGFNNQKTFTNEETEVRFDNINLSVSDQVTGAITVEPISTYDITDRKSVV